MPISEDEFDYNNSSSASQPSSTMSKAELRKTHKPIMEKRRRARINQCLNEIKSLILEAMNKDPARHSKLEKADILEMAVKHLQNVQRQQLAIAMASDPSVLRKFKTGFNECASEIDKYVTQSEGAEPGLKERMRSHLQKCISGIEQVAHFNFPGFSPFINNPSQGQNRFAHNESDDQNNNNNNRIQLPHSIQLIPSRLPSGEIALLVPNSRNLPLPTITHQPPRQSAFAAVIPSTSSTSDNLRTPPVSPNERGFRPVQPSSSKTLFVPPEEEQVQSQVAHVSSTSMMEVKTIKFPIHGNIQGNYVAPERRLIVAPPESRRKISEPLCIITNQAERYKQAQMRGDSVSFEENRSQGLKRKFSEISGLLMSAHDYSRQSKIMKPESLIEDSRNRDVAAGPSRVVDAVEDDPDQSNDMWRPW